MPEQPDWRFGSLANTCNELEARLRADSTTRAESFLAERTDWNGEAALDLIYTEYVTRTELQRQELADEICRRFPQHAAELRLQLAFDELTSAPHHGDSQQTHSDSTLNGTAPPAILPARPTNAELVGGRYELLEEIGHGGAAIVYRARQVDLNRIVAIKLLNANLESDRSLRLRFSFEGAVIARLRHANIVQVFEVGESEGRAFLALEYCEGGTLAEKIATARPSVRESAELVRTLALAMHEAHRAGIVHRDLKPANILLSAGGTAKIADFGLAKLLEEQTAHTRSGAILGTPCYMAPEQVTDAGHNVSPAADVYAMGAILYELLTGRPPFAGAAPFEILRRVSTEDPTPPRRLNRAVPRDLETICLKCLQKLPHERYSGMTQFAEDLERYLEDRPVAARPVGAFTRLGRAARRRPAIYGLAATLLLSLCGAGVIWAWNAHRLNLQREATTRAFQAAFQELHYLYQMTRKGIETKAGTIPLSERQRNVISTRFETFLNQYAHEVPVRRDVVYGYKCLALLHRENGDDELAARFAEKAIASGERFSREASEFPALRRRLPVNYYDLGELYEFWGEAAQAARQFQLATVAGRENLRSEDAPYEYETREIMAQSHRRIAFLLRETDPAAAVQEYEAACREHRALSQKWSDDVALQVRLAKYLIEMGVSKRDLRRFDEALLAFDEARRVCEGAQPKNDHDRSLALRQHSDACFRIGQIHARTDANVARPWYRAAIDSLEQCLTEQPYLVVQRLRLAQLHATLGRNHWERQRWNEAISSFDDAVKQYEQLLQQDPTNDEFRSQMLTCRNSIREIQRVSKL